jgi:hypothetical protein
MIYQTERNAVAHPSPDAPVFGPAPGAVDAPAGEAVMKALWEAKGPRHACVVRLL